MTNYEKLLRLADTVERITSRANAVQLRRQAEKQGEK